MTEFNRRELLLKGSSAAAAAAAAYALRGPARTLLPEQRARCDDDGLEPRSRLGHRPVSLGRDRPGVQRLRFGRAAVPGRLRDRACRVRHGPPLLLSYDASELAVENTGHVVEVPIPAGVEDVLQIGGDRYQLTQYHFHAPSEHTVNGRHADVEAHFVHTNAAGDTAVVGVFFHIGRRPNPLLETILLNAPETSGEEGPSLGEANPAELFSGLEGSRSEARGRPRRRVLRLRGSLTTPGCTENVRWSVLSDGGHVSRAAVRHFHAVIAQFADYGGYRNNNRPVQPLNGRTVQLRCGTRRHH